MSYQLPPGEYQGFAYAVECARDHLIEAKELALLHWQETEGYRHGLTFNPDYDRILKYEDGGQALWFTMRRDGALMGHAFFYLSRSTHTQQLMATEDVIYVKPEARIGRNALKFGQYWHDSLARLGVREVCVTVKLINKAGRFAEALGYKPVAMQYVKVLGDQHEIQNAA